MTSPNERGPKLAAVLELCDYEATLAEFQHRIVVQKLAYLFQELGVDLGYKDFEWTLRGVWSRTLADDMAEWGARQ